MLRKRSLSRFISIFLAVVLILSNFSISVAADVGDVTITGAGAVVVGKTLQLGASVGGINASQKVTWSVSGNTEPGTTISPSGLLTVANIEGAKALTVSARAVEDSSKFGTASITVEDLPFSMSLSKNDLVLHYIFDTNEKGPNNTFVKDYSPKGNDTNIKGTVNASQWTSTGFNFLSANSNWIQLPATANLVNPQMTFIFRGTRTGTMSGNQVFFCGRSGWSGNGLWINNATNIFHNGVSAASKFGTDYTNMFPTTTTPVEFAYSVDARTSAATGFIMKDGVITSTAVAQSAMTSTSTTYGIGANVWGPDEWMNNIRLNKYMVFNRKLSESEATEVYQGRLDPYKAGLNAEILSAMDRNETYYTSDSLDMFRSAIRAAKLVLKNPSATSAQVDAAITTLVAAKHKLVAVSGVVDLVTVNPPVATVNLAMTQQFTADVKVGNINVPKSVEWSVDSTKSSITQSGLLSIAPDEEKDILTVTATSAVDYTKVGSARVTVTKNPAVISINVTPQLIDITTGEKQAFTANLVTVAGGEQTVNWNVTGGTASTIDEKGLLFVGYGETAKAITITATSTLNPSKSASATASIYYITGVTITPPTAAVEKGRTSVFSAAVNGLGIPESAKEIIWEITSAKSANTSINSYGALIVDKDEAANTLDIKASSGKDPSKFATFTVTLADFKPETTTPINGYYNTFKLNPVTAATYGDNVVLTDWTSTGNWRTIANQTAAPVMSTNSGLTFNAGSTAWNIYSAAEALHIGSWTTYYRCVNSTKPSDNFTLYNGGKYSDIDYTIGMRINVGATSGAVVFRYQNYLNYYYVKQTIGSTNNISVGKVVNGTDTVLYTGSAPVSAGTWYNLRVILKGDNITVKRYTYAYWRVANTAQITTIINNKPLGDVFSLGYCGMWTPEGSANVHFNLVGIGSLDYNYTIANNTFTLTSGSQGNIKSLYINNGVNTNMNFVSNEDQNRVEMGINRYLGELKFRYQVGNGATTTASTGQSSDSREMSLEGTEQKININYTKPSTNAGGIKDFTVNEAYSLKTDSITGDDYIQFDIHIKNSGSSAITFKDISLPITWNAHWQADSPYENYTTHASNYVSYNSSYISVERGGGGGDKLILIPDSSTDAKLEYRRFISTQDYYTNMPEEFFIYSSGIAAETANGNFDQGYLPHTSLVLNSGEEKTLSFRIFKTSDYLGINDILEEQGLIAPVVNPGMVMPMDNVAEVDLRSIKNIESVTDTTPNPPAPAVFNPATVAVITKNLIKSTGTHNIYNIQFSKLGRNDITVTYDGGKKTVLQFWITEPLGDAIQRRADFIVDELWLSDERVAAIQAGSGSSTLKTFAANHKYGFLEMDNTTGVAGLHSGNSFYCSNSDYEQYYDAPDFLASKNIYLPVKREIDVLDTNLCNLVYEKQIQPFGSPLEGFLCVHCCYNTGGWGYGSDPVNKVMRVYNYPRIYNQFFSMYQIATRYPNITTFKHEAIWYLKVCAIVAKRGIEVSKSGTGAMGEQTLVDIVAALEKEGLTQYATDITNASKAKGNTIAGQAYPFGSEFSVDNTGEEGAYFNLRNFATATNRLTKMQQTIDKCLAWIGKTPVWYLQTTGRPAGNDWWMFQYAVGLQAKAYADWFFNYADDTTRDYYGDGKYSEDMWRMVYPAKMSPFVHIQSGQPEINIGPNKSTTTGKGVLGTVWGNIKPTHPYNWNQGFPYSTSAEADISLWAGIQLLSSDVVPHDPSFGLTGYGCEVTSGTADYTKETSAKTYDVIPKDGLFRRLNVVGSRVQVELIHDQYTSAKIHEDFNAIKLSLKNVEGTAHAGSAMLRGFEPGEYNIRVDNVLQENITITDKNSFTDVKYELLDGAEHELLIIKKDIDNTVDADGIVKVEVTPSLAFVAKGQTEKFSASVLVTDDTLSKAVTWSLTGANSTSTSIDETNGELTVDADETALTLTVKATSAVNPTKFGTSTIRLFEIKSITVTPMTASVEKGKGLKFNAVVTHENAPEELQGVVWSVEGNCTGTSIDTSGYLTVAEDETAQYLTVKATPGDPSKVVTILVTVTDRIPITLESLQLYYKFDGSGVSGDLRDYSPNAYDTTINGTIDMGAWSNDGFSFNGGNYIKLPSTVRLVNPEMTIVFKVKRTGNMSGCFFWGKNASDWASDGMFINTAEGLTVFHNGTATSFSLKTNANTLFPLGQWTEVAYSIDTTGDSAKGLLTVNGVEYTATDVTIPTTAKLSNPSEPYNSIGMTGYSNEPLTGAIMSKYMIFDRALTESELLSVFNNTMTKAPGAVLSEVPTGTAYINSIDVDSIILSTNPGRQTVEYACTTDETMPTYGWQDELTFTGLEAETDYYVFARAKENEAYATGIAVSVIISTLERNAGAQIDSAPTVSEKPTSSSITVNPVTATLNPGSQTFEYAISETDSAPTMGWQDSTTFTGLTANETYYVYARTKQNASYSAGEAKGSVAIRTASLAPFTITLLDIPDVPIPGKGHEPPIAYINCSQYTGIITWAPGDKKTFEASNYFIATITLTAAEGYTLDGVPANSFTVAGATSVTNDADSGVVIVIFPIQRAQGPKK